MKNTSLVGRDKVVLGIGVQFFNFFNHPNFGPPDNYSSDPWFGEISTMEMPADRHFGIWSWRRCFSPDDPTESADPLLGVSRLVRLRKPDCLGEAQSGTEETPTRCS